MKKKYEVPVIYIEEYELEDTLGNLCGTSGGDDIPGFGGDDFE